MSRATLQFVLIHLLVALFLFRESTRSPADSVDSWFIDWLAGNAPRERHQAPLLLVEINDSTIKDQGWPLKALDYSLFMQAVLAQDPAVLGIVPVMTWDETEGQDQYAKVLHSLILKTPKLLLGARLGYREDPDVVLPTERIPILPHVQGPITLVPEYELIVSQPSQDISLSAATGFTNVRGNGKLVQRVPLMFRYRGQLVPSFVLQAAMLWTKVTPDEVVVTSGKEVALGNKITIPIDMEGTMLVDFATPVSRFGLDDLLLAVAQRETEQSPLYSIEKISGNLVLLARTDAASRTIVFPDGQPASQGELFAEAIATIQNGTFYRRIGDWFDLAVAAGALVAGLFFLGRGPQTIIIVATLLLLLYLFGAVSLFGTERLWAPFFLPSGLMLFVTIYALVSPRRARRKPERKPAPAL